MQESHFACDNIGDARPSRQAWKREGDAYASSIFANATQVLLWKYNNHASSGHNTTGGSNGHFNHGDPNNNSSLFSLLSHPKSNRQKMKEHEK